MLLSPQNIFLLVAAGVNLTMSILVFSRGVRNNKINLYFSLLTFFSFFWAISEFLARILENDVWIFFNNLTYFSGLAIALSFLYFSVHFPYIRKKYSRAINISLFILFILFSVVIFSNRLFVVGSTKDPALTEYTLNVNQITNTAYNIFFVLIVLMGLYNLFIKYLNVEGIMKQSIKAILIAILVAFLAGSYFDIILPYFGEFHYFWLGPVFTFLINYVVFRFIYNKTT